MATINKNKVRFKRNNKRLRFVCEGPEMGHYYSKWNGRRNWYIRQHPLDELELVEDRVVAAAHVHHVVPFGKFTSERDRMFYLMCADNLMSLSKENHTKVHKHYNELTDKQKEYIEKKIKKVNEEYINYILES